MNVSELWIYPLNNNPEPGKHMNGQINSVYGVLIFQMDEKLWNYENWESWKESIFVSLTIIFSRKLL